MSRTYRRKGKPNQRDWSVTCELIKFAPSHWEWVEVDPASEKYKQKLARYHSDAGTIRFKEPGPMWFVKEFTQVPYRRKCRDEIQHYIKGDIEDVVLESMPYLGYWT